jgi:hypothetical protein
MKKSFLYCVLLLFPLFASAQNDQTLIKDFSKKVKGLATCVAVNDHLNVMQIKLDDQDFELVAMDEKMQVVWRTTLKGNPLTCGMFKGHLLALAGSGSFQIKQKENAYAAYLVDEKTGKVLLQHDLYKESAEVVEEVRVFFAEDGSGFSIALRQTTLKNKFGLIRGNEQDTQGLLFISLNEKLEPTMVKPDFEAKTFAGLAVAKDGSFYLFSIGEDTKLKISKYDAGQSQSKATIVQDIHMRAKSDIIPNINAGLVSPTAPNTVYFGMLHKNPEKDMELSVIKADFNTNTSKVVSEVLKKEHVKAIEKSSAPLDKKIKKAEIDGNYDSFAIHYIAEYKGLLILTFNDYFLSSFAGTTYPNYTATVINAYSTDLVPKFQQVLPTWGNIPFVDYHFSDNDMSTISNFGYVSFDTHYAQLDLGTGAWVKMQKLDKNKISGGDFASAANLWYKNSVVLVYQPLTHSSDPNVNISLQQNSR